MYSETYQKARKEFINCLCMFVIGVGFPLVNAFGYWLPIIGDGAEKGLKKGLPV